MLIKVMLPNEEEGLFNGNCQVVALLDAIKKAHGLQRDDVIDLCTLDGQVKDLVHHLSEDGCSLLQLYELYLVVRVHDSGDAHLPYYIPVLETYAHNRQFVAILNHKTGNAMCVRVRLKNQPPVYRPRPLEHLRKPHSSDRSRKRHHSVTRHAH